MTEKRTILVIEDDKDISHFIDISLSKESYGVLVAETAAEGLFLFSSYCAFRPWLAGQRRRGFAA